MTAEAAEAQRGAPGGGGTTDADAVEAAGEVVTEPEIGAGSPKKRRKESVGQTIGGVLFGFEQQVLRTMPPPQELVHHARPDTPIPAGDGSLIHIAMPGVSLPDDDGDGVDPFDREDADDPEGPTTASPRSSP